MTLGTEADIGVQTGPPSRLSGLPPSLAVLTQADPAVLARGLAATRIALGAGLLLAPRWLTQPWLREKPNSDAAFTAWRVAGARDIALGLGAIMAAKHGSAGLRGWLEAGAFVDGADVTSLLRDRSFYTPIRLAACVSATTSAALSLFVARRLSGR